MYATKIGIPNFTKQTLLGRETNRSRNSNSGLFQNSTLINRQIFQTKINEETSELNCIDQI
jgi:hypothetical protein